MSSLSSDQVKPTVEDLNLFGNWSHGTHVTGIALAGNPFARVVVGDVTSASGNEGLLRGKGVKVDVIEDQDCIALYDAYRRDRPDLDLEDWKGLAAVQGS